MCVYVHLCTYITVDYVESVVVWCTCTCYIRVHMMYAYMGCMCIYDVLVHVIYVCILCTCTYDARVHVMYVYMGCTCTHEGVLCVCVYIHTHTERDHKLAVYGQTGERSLSLSRKLVALNLCVYAYKNMYIYTYVRRHVYTFKWRSLSRSARSLQWIDFPAHGGPRMTIFIGFLTRSVL
jgi:hypothetical protein